MRKTLIMVILLALAVLAMGKTLSIESQRLETEVVIDGSDQEWEGKRIYNEKDNVISGFQYDDNNLYVLFISKDTDLERQMLMSGFTIWLNTKGKTKKESGLMVPGLGRPERQENADVSEERSQRDRDGGIDEMMLEKIEQAPTILFITDKDDEKTPYSLNEIKGFEFARSSSDRGIVYEFKIPLDKTEEQLFGFIIGEKLAFGLECDAPSKDAQSRPEGGMSGNRGGGGGGRGSGGGSGGGRPGGGDSEMPRENENAKDYLIWSKISFTD